MNLANCSIEHLVPGATLNNRQQFDDAAMQLAKRPPGVQLLIVQHLIVQHLINLSTC